tara:strand:- start:131 stop:607 length:477 start_codon:yes stop_codon:yes gene_type:complete
MKSVNTCALGFNFPYLSSSLLQYAPPFKNIELSQIVKNIKADDSLLLVELYGLELEAGAILAQVLIEKEFIAEETFPQALTSLKAVAEKDYVFLHHKDNVFCEDIPLAQLALCTGYRHLMSLSKDFETALKSNISEYSEQEDFRKLFCQKVYDFLLTQ